MNTKFPMDLSKFRRVSSDKKTTTLRHPAGHTITLAHTSLSPKMRSDLAALKMADGGEVPSITEDGIDLNKITAPEPSPMPEAAAPAQPPVVINVGQPQAAAPQAMAPQAAPVAPQAPAPVEPAAPAQPKPEVQEAGLAAPQQPNPMAQPSDPFGVGAQTQATESGLMQEEAAIKGQAAAESQKAQAQSRIQQESARKQQAIAEDWRKNSQELQDEYHNFVDAIKSQEIDPNRYIGRMDTAQKAQTAVGLILGGIGSGLTGGENPALKFLGQQIDRDIEAQRAELGKKQSLLSANLQRMGNLKDATLMTQGLMNGATIAKLEVEAAKAASPIAKANALKAIGELNAKNAAILGQLTMRRTLLSGVKQGNVDANRVVEMLVPESERPAARKELKEIQELGAARDNTLSAFDQIAMINTVSNRALSPLQSSRQIDGILGAVIPALSKATAGRFTEADAEILKEVMPHLGDDDETLNIKRAKLDALISEKMHAPQLEFYGIDPKALGRYNAQGGIRIAESAPKIRESAPKTTLAAVAPANRRPWNK